MKKVLAVLATLVLVFSGSSPAHADLFTSNYDDYTYPGTPRNFDIDFISYTEFPDSPNFHYFAIWMKGPITSSQFNDGNGSWAMVEIDANGDNVGDYRIETNQEDLYSSYGSPATLFRLSGGEWEEVTSCSPQFYGDLDSNETYIAFTLPYECMKLPKNFGFFGYSDYIADDDAYFDYMPSGEGEFFRVSHNFSSAPSVSVSRDAPSATGDTGGKVANPSQAPLALETLSPSVGKSVVTIFCAGGLGSGWSAKVNLSSSHTSAGFKSFIVTNHHVVEDCLDNTTVTLMTSDGNSHVGRVISWDEANDLAGIVTTASIPGLLWRGERPSQGWWVGVLGAPRGLSGYLTTGLISIISGDSTELGITSPVNPGNSGGPVFDRTGRVIATVSWKLLESEGLAFAKTAPLLCLNIIKCGSGLEAWVSAPAPSTGSTPAEDPTSSLLVQKAGSQVFITSADLQGSFEVYEDGFLIDTFTFDGVTQAHIVEQRVTGALQIRNTSTTGSEFLAYASTKSLLWFQNVDLGKISETSLTGSATEKVINLVADKYYSSGQWLARDSKVTKFICTGIYRSGANAAEKLTARKQAKVACETAERLAPVGSEISFFFQTKPTAASSYVGKVLVTVKGVEKFVESRLGR